LQHLRFEHLQLSNDCAHERSLMGETPLNHLVAGNPSVQTALVRLAALALLLVALPATALNYTGSSSQFAGGFVPGNAPYGGFGGAWSCTPSKVPVVFLHGNGDEAKNWDYPSSTGVPSAYDAFKNAGYEDCELFGVNYLSSSERSAPQLNYHDASTADLVADFIADVLDYTGADEVDVVAHSMGVTVGLHALDYGGLWSSVRRFVSIGGALRGLASCYWAGYANAYVSTCGSQNVWASDVFGFYPHTWYAGNPRLGNGGFRDRPGSHSGTRFYSLRAGYHDQVHCTTASYHPGCWATAVFDTYPNVAAQLDVGDGSTAAEVDYDFSDWSPYNLSGGDLDGVGHFRSKNNTGAVQVNFLTSSCTGAACCTGYAGGCGP
jgi:pimeloyl-ACP methyl ester carboxylesterase